MKDTNPAITQFPTPVHEKSLKIPDAQKIEQIEEKFKEILEILGLDTSDPSLAETPHRIAKMYVQEVFWGLKPENFPDVSFFPQEMQEEGSNMVFVKVTFTSFCEHHFVPFHGKAYIAYVPNKKLIGLSKIPRIVSYFAKRPQVQERLTSQIADALCMLLENENVAVSLTAEHFCMIARGVEDENSHTITNVLCGQFKTDPSLRHEFFESINRNRD